MAVFIELTTFDFDRAFREQVGGNATRTGGGDSSLAGKIRARRPVRGIEVKHDSFAYLRVVDASGVAIPIFDSSDPSGMSPRPKSGDDPGDPSGGNSNFLLQSIQEGRAEKNQIVETFGDAYIFFFGENPRFVQVQGLLLNSNDFQWRTEWWANYNNFLRGTKLTEMGARMYLFYDDIVLEGYIMEAQAQEGANMPWQVSFSFKMFVTNYSSVNMAGDPNFPVRSSIQLPPDVSLTDSDAAKKLIQKYKGNTFTDANENASERFTQPGGGLLQSSPNGAPKPFGEYKKLSDALREAPRTMAVSPDIWKAIDQLPAAQQKETKDLIMHSNTKLRGLYADNTDEIINFGGGGSTDRPMAIAPATLSAQEADDLFQYAINLLGQYGADVNNPSAMNGMGWGAGAPPTYGAQASWSPETGWQTSTIGPGSNNDPLNSVYGAQTSYNAVSSSRSKYYEGSGNYAYGYASAYASGPGFGQAGFGDYGGGGFGAGISTGDPGYKDPDKFTSAGVANNQAAYDRFIAPKTDDTSITAGGSGISLGVSGSASASVGASMSYNEAPTAFSITSVEGTLDPSGSVTFGFSV